MDNVLAVVQGLFPEAPNAPPAHHLPEKLNVVHVRSQFHFTLICKIQPTGVIVTVLAQGTKEV